MDALKRADWTPLMLACTKSGNGAVVAALLEGGADPALQNKDGWTAFHLAARAANDDEGEEGALVVLETLLRRDGSLWNTRSVRQEVFTFGASSMIDHGCTFRSRNGRSPLHTAALNRRRQAR